MMKTTNYNLDRERLDKVELAMAPLHELPTTVSELASNILVFQDRIVALEEEVWELRGLEELHEDVWVTLDTCWDNLHELSGQMIVRHIGEEGQGFGRGRANNDTKRKISQLHAYDGV